MSTMSPAADTPRRSTRAQRRDETLERLLGIIERRLEAGETFSDLAVEQLAAEVGISRTTFYVYFEDKSDVLRAWFSAVTEELNQAAAAWWSLGPGLSRPDVRAALAGIVAAFRSHSTLMVATHDAVATDPATRALVVRAWQVYVDGLSRHIEAGQAAGFVDPSLLPAETAYWLQWMAERGLHQLPNEKGPVAVARLIDAYTAIVWNTLYAPTGRNRS